MINISAKHKIVVTICQLFPYKSKIVGIQGIKQKLDFMRAIYTKQFPGLYFRLVPVFIAAFTLVWYNRTKSFTSSPNKFTPTTNSVTADRAPEICQVSADETITKCGTSTVIHTDPGFNNTTWNDGSTGPDLTVTQSGQYWWQFIDMSRNTVTNGDFTSGNSGFTSQYTYISETGSTGSWGALSAEGYYTTSTSPHNTHTSFSDFGDHTTGTGTMMVLNGSPQNNVTVWGQNITVEPNTTYIFSIWAASAHPSNPAKLTFSINGSLLGTIQLTTTTGSWQNFTVQWTSGSSTSAAIGIVNQNTIASGNDFALDDIVFAPICRKYFNVTLYPNPPKPSITSS